jgi:hypothetical protein
MKRKPPSSLGAKMVAIGKAVVAISAATATVYGAVEIGRKHLYTPPCEELVLINWAGWQCNPPVPRVMLGGCDDTRDINWLTGEVRRLAHAGYLQVPFQTFKLIPDRLIDGHIKAVWLCEADEPDEECIGRKERGQRWHAVRVGDPTDFGRAVRLISRDSGYSSAQAYLDKDQETWCMKAGEGLKPIAMP